MTDWTDLDEADRAIALGFVDPNAEEREIRRRQLLAAETEREEIRLRARRAAEQRIADEQHRAADTAEGRNATGSSWTPLDLTDILAGTYEPEQPALMPRTDGVHLLYAGRVHSFQGESESGKSMIAQGEAARVLTEGGRVLYLDFESDASVVVGRILQMGAPRDAIAQRLAYLRPATRPEAAVDDRTAYAHLLGQSYDMVVIDGVTEAAAVFGVASKDNDEITTWHRAFARRIAHRTGGAVVQVDHVTKDADSRGRFAIGAQAKMSALDGAAYVIEVKEPLGRGLRGVIAMRVAKDRPGAIRPHCGKFRASDRTQEAARVIVDSTTEGTILITVEPYADAGGAGDEGKASSFRPTSLMDKVSLFLQTTTEPQSESKILSAVKGKEAAVKAAVDVLVDEGYVERTIGPRKAKLHSSIRPYDQVLDPRSDKYDPREAFAEAEAEVTASGLPPTAFRRPPPPPGVNTGAEEEEVDRSFDLRQGGGRRRSGGGSMTASPDAVGTQSGRTGTWLVSGEPATNGARP